jgi:hypothetical protein
MDKQLSEIKRGERASEVLNNELYKEAVANVREGIIKSMAISPLGDAETHNRLVIALQLLAQIEKQLTDVMATGKMAALSTSDKRGIFR